VLWEKLLEYKFYNYSNNLSAAWIWSRIHRIGNSRYSMMREKLGYLEGGSETLLVKMREYIVSKGGEIYLNSPVSHVTIEDGVVKGVEVKGVLVKFDKVVSTIPLPYIPEIIPDLPSDILKKFKSIKNISVICVVVKLNKAVTDNFWLNINDSSMDIPGLVEYTNLRPLDGEHIVYVPYYVPGNNQKFFDSDELFIEKVKKYLKIINPTLKNENFIELYVSRYRYAQPICPPKYLESLPPVDLPINGLWVADTSYYYPEDRGISESINFGKTIAKKLLS